LTIRFNWVKDYRKRRFVLGLRALYKYS